MIVPTSQADRACKDLTEILEHVVTKEEREEQRAFAERFRLYRSFRKRACIALTRQGHSIAQQTEHNNVERCLTRSAKDACHFFYGEG